jgi:hypothetical protein
MLGDVLLTSELLGQVFPSKLGENEDKTQPMEKPMPLNAPLIDHL